MILLITILCHQKYNEGDFKMFFFHEDNEEENENEEDDSDDITRSEKREFLNEFKKKE